MKALIRPSTISGSIQAPPSKSMAHRLLIAAGLSGGASKISNIAMSEDIKATIGCLTALGADIHEMGGSLGAATANYSSLEVIGTNPALSAATLLDCNESGSTLRFMIPIAALSENETVLHGSRALMMRPLSVYEEIFEAQRLSFEKSYAELKIKGRLHGGEFEIPGDISSQFVSGLLLALPLTDKDSVIKLTKSVESRPYIDMTLSAINIFGVKAWWEDDRTLIIPGRQKYVSADVTVEGDWSNAAYIMALEAKVDGVDDNSLQGDKICKDYFKLLREDHASLDISDCPDLGPVLMAYAAMNKGCILTGAGRLKIKESDRGAAMQAELAKFGIDIVIKDDIIEVDCMPHEPSSDLYGHNDHRIVMALSALCIRFGGVIEGAEAVNKSYPDFFSRIRAAGADIELQD